jgi:hypothetical protein
MKTLKEYRLKKDIITSQTFYITKGAEIVNLVDLDFDLALIALCDSTSNEADLRTFRVCSLYETIYDSNIKYIGNFGTQHVIEIL